MYPVLLRDPRYRSLDAWRGLACLLVVVHHVGAGIPGTPPGTGFGPWVERVLSLLIYSTNMGVPLFFVISGYCIAASADANRRKGAWSWSFMGRRLWRIFPTYWAAVAWFVGCCLLLDFFGLGRLYRGAPFVLGLKPPGALTWQQWVGNLTLTETWRIHVWGHATHFYTGIAWTLCYEEQFYLVTFLLLVFFPRHLFRAFAAVTVVCAALRVAAYDSGGLDGIDGFFPYLWHEFAVGLAVYWRLNMPGPGWGKRAVEGVIVALFGVGVWGGLASTAQASVFGLALIGLREAEGRLPGLPGSAVLHACGRRSYSLYLTHMPICIAGVSLLYEWGSRGFWRRVLVAIPVITPVAVAVGWGFFWLVERHFLRPPVVRRPPREPLPASESPLAGEQASDHAAAS